MLKSRPEGEPNVQGANIRFKEVDGTFEIEYDLYFKRSQVEEWRIPADTQFDPPEWFKEGIDIVAWSINRGTVRKPDFEWIWVEQAEKYYRSIQSTFTKNLRKKKFKTEMNQIKHQLDTTLSNFSDLFDEE